MSIPLTALTAIDIPDEAITVVTDQGQRLVHQVAGSLWMVTTNLTGSATVRVYNSTDDGSTWVQKDAASAPGTHGEQAFDSYVVGTTIYIAYLPTSGGLLNTDIAVVQFDCIAGTYGATTAAITGKHTASDFRMVVRSDGTIIVCYVRTNFDYVVTTYSGGVWAAAQIIVTPPNHNAFFAGGICVGADDTAHITWYDGPDFTHDNFHYRAFDAASTIGGSQVILATTSPASAYTVIRSIEIFNGKLYAMPSTGFDVWVYVSDAIPATSWSLAATVLTAADVDSIGGWLNVNGSTLTAYWMVGSLSFPPPANFNGVDYSATTDGATWSPAATFVDVYGLLPTSVNQLVFDCDVITLSNGGLGIALSCQQENGPGSDYILHYGTTGPVIPPTPPPPAIISGGGGDGNYTRSIDKSQTHWSIGMKPPRPQDCCVPEKYTPSRTAFYKPQQRTPEPCCIPDWYRNIKRPPRG